jgi:hypothetical protein
VVSEVTCTCRYGSFILYGMLFQKRLPAHLVTPAQMRNIPNPMNTPVMGSGNGDDELSRSGTMPKTIIRTPRPMSGTPLSTPNTGQHPALSPSFPAMDHLPSVVTFFFTHDQHFGTLDIA